MDSSSSEIAELNRLDQIHPANNQSNTDSTVVSYDPLFADVVRNQSIGQTISQSTNVNIDNQTLLFTDKPNVVDVEWMVTNRSINDTTYVSVNPSKVLMRTFGVIEMTDDDYLSIDQSIMGSQSGLMSSMLVGHHHRFTRFSKQSDDQSNEQTTENDRCVIGSIAFDTGPIKAMEFGLSINQSINQWNLVLREEFDRYLAQFRYVRSMNQSDNRSNHFGNLSFVTRLTTESFCDTFFSVSFDRADRSDRRTNKQGILTRHHKQSDKSSKWKHTIAIQFQHGVFDITTRAVRPMKHSDPESNPSNDKSNKSYNHWLLPFSSAYAQSSYASDCLISFSRSITQSLSQPQQQQPVKTTKTINRSNIYTDDVLRFESPSQSSHKRTNNQTIALSSSQPITQPITHVWSVETGLTIDLTSNQSNNQSNNQQSNVSLSFGMGASTRGVYVSFGLTTPFTQVRMPIYLTDTDSLSPTTKQPNNQSINQSNIIKYLFLIPITASFVYLQFIRPIYQIYSRRSIRQKETEKSDKQSVDQATASSIRRLLGSVADHRRWQEETKEEASGDGLMLVEARYGWMTNAQFRDVNGQPRAVRFVNQSNDQSNNQSRHPSFIESIDVLVPLWFHVRQSTLTVTNHTKSQMLGFETVDRPIDLSNDLVLCLYVRYIWQNEVRHVAVLDDESLTLPSVLHTIVEEQNVD